MIVSYHGRKFCFSFKHSKPRKLDYRATICTISEIMGITPVALSRQVLICGTAVCSPLDQFCKERGRKISLTRALRGIPVPFINEPKWNDQPWIKCGLYLNKELRKMFWDVYNRRKLSKNSQKHVASPVSVLEEGMVKKGGINKKPTKPPPPPPKGQGGRKKRNG